MPYLCDSCQEALHRDRNGYFVGSDETSDCPQNDRGHTWEGRIS